MKHVLHAALATLALAAATACSEAAPEPAAVDLGEMIAGSSAWTPSAVTADLPVDDATRQEIDAGLRALHESLLALDGREPTDEEARAIHARHAALWESLDPEVRDLLAARLHERMREHHGEGMESLHERMRRLHGADHDPAGSGS